MTKRIYKWDKEQKKIVEIPELIGWYCYETIIWPKYLNTEAIRALSFWREDNDGYGEK